MCLCVSGVCVSACVVCVCVEREGGSEEERERVGEKDICQFASILQSFVLIIHVHGKRFILDFFSKPHCL